MLATASAQPRPDLGPRVPVEWIGRARTLRSRVAEAHAAWEKAVDALIAPLCTRDGFTPVYTKQTQSVTAARWRNLPQQAWGRLRDPVTKIVGGKLSIAEFRLVDFRVGMAHWNDDEPAVAVAVFTVGMELPSAFCFESKIVAVIGLHALARRFERGDRRDDLAVARDLLPIALAAPRLLSRGEFEVAIPNGRWIGASMLLDGKPCVAVRTFVSD